MHCFNSSVFIAIRLLTLCGALVDGTGDCLVSTSVVSVCVVVCVCISHCSVIIKIINFYVLVFFTPRAHARARGYVIGRGVYIL